MDNKEDMQTKLSILIPSHNNAKTIKESIESALAQEYPHKEIIVIDDCSQDDTVKIAMQFPVKVVVNTTNLGIGKNLAKAMDEANGKYVLYLCGDDVFTNSMIASDVVKIFDTRPDIGVVGRYYYQFLDGYPGAVMLERSDNILLSSINPSGMAFRKRDIVGDNTIFLEMPKIVAQYLQFTRWTMLEYDTVAVRLNPTVNTGCQSSYYSQSPIQVLTEFYGKDFKYHFLFIQLKNRAPKILWREICLAVKINPNNLKETMFWFSAITAVLIPRSMLIPLSRFYRHRITRRYCEVIQRPSEVINE